MRNIDPKAYREEAERLRIKGYSFGKAISIWRTNTSA
jgi:hypothetical protein